MVVNVVVVANVAATTTLSGARTKVAVQGVLCVKSVPKQPYCTKVLHQFDHAYQVQDRFAFMVATSLVDDPS